jgi:hypothetical protein
MLANASTPLCAIGALLGHHRLSTTTGIVTEPSLAA